MDPLTDVLRAMRLSGAVFLDAELTAPWCLRSQVLPEDCRPYMATPAQLIAYHYVLEGEFAASVAGAAPVTVGRGQILLLPRNDPHVLGSDLSLEPETVDELVQAGNDGLARLRLGGGGARCRILCGYLGCDDRDDPLVASLPPILTLHVGDASAEAWIEGSIRYAARELAAGGPGVASSLGRMAELLFGEAIREYARALPEDQRGWLAGVRDPYVGRALALLHGEWSRPWTLDELSRAAGLSRSALGERFSRTVGLPPMRYLARRRLQRAARRLREDGGTVSRIAHDSGYDSEAAFTRAFKREFGVPPAAFRKGSAAGD